MEFTFEEQYENAEHIPAEFRPLYQETDGGLVLDADRFGGVRAAITGLNKALKASRNEAKTYQKKAERVDLGKLSEFGETPDGILSTFEERLAEAKRAAAASGDEDAQRRLEKARAELVAQNEKVINEKESLVSRYRGQLEAVLGEQAALQALSGKATDPDLVLPFVLRNLKTVETDDGRLQVVVVDGDGDPRVNPVTQQPLSIADLVTEMREQEKFAPLFRSEAPSGGGAAPTARPTAKPGNRVPMNSVQKIAAGLRKGQARNGRGIGQVN